MSFLIRLIGKKIGQRIEAGSSRGALFGAVLGASLLGTLAAAGWATGATGFMGAGLTLAGVILGALFGALIGAGMGPEDRLIQSDRQTSVSINDYNRKLVAVVPLLISFAVSIGAGVILFQDRMKNELDAGDASSLRIVILLGVLVFLGSAIYLSFQNLSVTFGETIRVNRLFSRKVYAYTDAKGWGLITSIGQGPPFASGEPVIFVMVLPDRSLKIPIAARQAEELHTLLDGLV